MDKAKIVAAIAYRLGNVRGQTEAIEREMEMVISNLENDIFHPWFLLSFNNFYEGKAEEWRVPIPEDFLMEYEEGALYLQMPDKSWTPLTKAAEEEVKTISGTGMPKYYVLTNTVFRLFPTPDIDYTIEMLYYRRTAGLPVDVNPWYLEAAEWLIWEVCALMGYARRDKRASEFASQAAVAKMKLVMKDEERKEVNLETLVGGRTLWD